MVTADSSDLFERVRFRGDPVANPASLVISDHARFTVLTPRLLRMEWAETGEFEDRSTYAFPIRRAAVPPFTARQDGDDLVIDTGALILRYRQHSGRFGADNLAVSFDLSGRRQTWTPGMPSAQNLRGTRRTLDGCEGDASLGEGLLSRAGWALFDDSHSVVFPDDGWVTPRPEHDLQDWYFFAYGHDYKGALAEYTRFGGSIPLIPRFVLGAWWSRYWAYSAEDLKELVGGFEQHDLPLDVLVVDMDWHTPHSWTGYTWNRELFPDPPAFLRWVHDKGLRVTLNLHPAQGVQHFEEVYPRFATAMGVDPQSGQDIPFRITDKRFVKPYFELIHHAMEEDGVDFWWMDWQQGESSELKGLDPLPWINHLHFSDSRRRGRRPMLYSRWGGLGNHRYYIGFSGDTIVGWTALQFQPYLTATAANVAYSWWSHDIGGHMGGATAPELYARWVQFGALSPCLRLHSTKDPLAERRPWKYPEQVYQAARAAFHWRYRLVPYTYTMARIASDTGVSICRPMYYDYPEEEAAYAARYQYMLGDQMIAAPIVYPADPETGMASTDIWVPEGTWIDYATRETFVGPRWVRIVGDLNRMPMLIKAGAILPLAPGFGEQQPPCLASGTTDAIPHDWLILSVLPGADGGFRLYEDDGITEAYRAGQCEWTEIRTHVEDERTWTVEIAATEGRCDALPPERSYDILLEGSLRPEVVRLDDEQTADWEYNPETLTTIVHVPLRDKRQPIRVTAFAQYPISVLGAEHNRGMVVADVRRLLGDRCPADSGDVDAVLRTDAPGRADAVARLGGPLVRWIELSTPEEAAQQLGRAIVGGPARADEPYDLQATFTLFRGGKPEQHTIHMEHTTGSHILNTPFAFDGQAQTMHWEATVQITWRGQMLTSTHRSSTLFPTIPLWRAVVYDRQESPLMLGQVMSARGTIVQKLDWKAYQQQPDALDNLHEPYVVLFAREHWAELQAGKPLAGYLTTTVISPDERDVVLRFGSAGATEVYLNGKRAHEAPTGEQAPEGPPIFRQTRRTAVMHLRAGANTLLIGTRPPQERRPFWFFGAALTTPGDELMTDLSFR